MKKPRPSKSPTDWLGIEINAELFLGAIAAVALLRWLVI